MGYAGSVVPLVLWEKAISHDGNSKVGFCQELGNVVPDIVPGVALGLCDT